MSSKIAILRHATLRLPTTEHRVAVIFLPLLYTF